VSCFWVCWSATQQSFQIEEDVDAIRRNRRSFLAGRATDFLPVGIFDGRAEAIAFTDELKEIRDARQASPGEEGGTDGSS